MATCGAAMCALLPALMVAASSAPRPAVPFESHGVCPFECCEYRTWTVEADTNVLTDRREGAAVAFRVRKGETVRGLTGVVVTTQLGRAEVRRPSRIGSERETWVQPGADIVVLHYVGEGYWRFWLAGRFDQDQLPEWNEACENDAREPIECAVQIVKPPEAEWWSKVRSRAGREGWTREMDHFGNVDACG